MISRIFGVIVAIAGVAILSSMLNSGMPTPLWQQPVEAYLGTAFSIGWLTGVPDWLAYVLAALVVALLIWILYSIGSWVGRLLFKPRH